MEIAVFLQRRATLVPAFDNIKASYLLPTVDSFCVGQYLSSVFSGNFEWTSSTYIEVIPEESSKS